MFLYESFIIDCYPAGGGGGGGGGDLISIAYCLFFHFIKMREKKMTTKAAYPLQVEM